MIKMVDDSNSNLFLGALIVSVIAAIIIIVEDFGGWYNWSTTYYYYLGFFRALVNIDIILLSIFLIVLAMLFYCAWISFIGFREPENISQEKIILGFRIALGVVIINIIGGIIFGIYFTIEDLSWWFEAGFYAGVIGGALTALLFHLINQKIST